MENVSKRESEQEQEEDDDEKFYWNFLMLEMMKWMEYRRMWRFC